MERRIQMASRGILLLMAAAMLMIAIAMGTTAAGTEEPAVPDIPTVVETVTLVDHAMLETAEVQEDIPDVDENQRIADALYAADYFWADIPLDAELQAYLRAACEEFNVDYALAVSVIWRETNFLNDIGDGGDSVGFFQIQKKWWVDLMENIGAENLMVPYENFRTGCAILSELTCKYGNLVDALTAYNTGSPGDSEYARAVLSYLEGLPHGK